MHISSDTGWRGEVMSKVVLVKGAAALALVFAAPASAYKIRAGTPSRGADLHETFTRVAQECLRESGFQRPRDCSGRFDEAVARVQVGWRDATADDSYASRWSDDPMRMLDTWTGRIGWAKQYVACEGMQPQGRAIDEVGLLCASHYGRLQFMHAQARLEDRGSNASEDFRDPALTRSNILAWARFAYRAATDEGFRASNYCQTVAALPHEGLQAALTFADQSVCADRTETKDGRPVRYLGWTVGTLFGTRCVAYNEEPCWYPTRPVNDRQARLGARGALLHLIQDSYSQSHVARVPADESVPDPLGRVNGVGGFATRVVCSRPVRYYDYGQQTDSTHAWADLPPRADPHRPRQGLHANCRDPNQREVDDILTASAVVLYYLNLETPDPDGLAAYLETRVFPG